MMSAKSGGRLIGIFLVVQLAGLIAPFVLLHALSGGEGGFLVNAAAASFQIKTAVFLLFANCVLTIGISIALYPVIRLYSEPCAVLLVAVGAIMFLMQAVDNAHILSMLSLSENYAMTGGRDEIFQAIASTLGSTRRWVHFTELFAIDAWLFTLYSLLFSFRLVPRALAVFGLLTVLLHFSAIPLMAFLGYPVVTNLGVPMAVSHLSMAVWLVAKGFREPI